MGDVDSVSMKAKLITREVHRTDMKKGTLILGHEGKPFMQEVLALRSSRKPVKVLRKEYLEEIWELNTKMKAQYISKRVPGNFATSKKGTKQSKFLQKTSVNMGIRGREGKLKNPSGYA